ncbi:MAG: glycosyltransferase [Alphaproteobacteria bacterium]|nr:glycosyltransferase [Alphaproteobacteria bacterium]
MPRKPAVLLNALHTSTGGGLIYLKGVLPHLAADPRVTWHLLAPAATLAALSIPAGVVAHTAPRLRFGMVHLWEQVMLPLLVWAWGCRAVLSNANYGPLLAPKASVILHTTPRAAAAWPGLFWRVYWGLLQGLTRLCAWRSPVFFSVAAHIVADYASHATQARLRLAPPAIDHAAIPPPVVRDPNLVLAVGDFYRQKNYPLLLQAFAKLRAVHPKARLMIVGRPVMDDVRNEVMTVARSLNVTAGLTLVPGLPHDQLLKALRQAAVYIATSSAEAFNMPVLEAMACGTPVVTLDTPFQREVAGAEPHSAAVLVKAEGDTAAGLAIALLGILSTPEIAETLRRRGEARAAQFTWANTARALQDGLASVLKLG